MFLPVLILVDVIDLEFHGFSTVLYYRYMPLIVPGVYLGAEIWTLGFHAYVQIALPLLTETVPSLPLVI